MTCFFRFPHTPHIAWLAEGQPRDDKVLSPCEALALLSENVVVEEKLDGANIGFSLDADGRIRVQNRGQYLIAPYSGQFARLTPWLVLHGEKLTVALAGNLILFGEWCAAKHSLSYDALPDWLLVFDVYDLTHKLFWSTQRRNNLAAQIGLVSVPKLKHGKFTLPALKYLLLTQQSRFRQGPLEGIIVRRESAEWCEVRAKLVRADFTQSIGVHWRRRGVEWNQLNRR